MFTVQLYNDDQVTAMWGCKSAEAPALHLGGNSLLRRQMDGDGCELHNADVHIAAKLHCEWQLPGSPPASGTYRPADGVNFLLAVYATYCKGSRMRAVAERHESASENKESRLNFVVMDRESVEAGIRVREPYIVVSIRSPKQPEPKIARPGHCRAIHFEVFHDAEPCEDLMDLPDEIKLMAPEQAKDIVEFFNEHRPYIKTVVIHCEAGWSRSPAIAAALAKHCGLDDSLYFEHYDPNPYVYSLMIAATKTQSMGTKA